MLTRLSRVSADRSHLLQPFKRATQSRHRQARQCGERCDAYVRLPTLLQLVTPDRWLGICFFAVNLALGDFFEYAINQFVSVVRVQAFHVAAQGRSDDDLAPWRTRA